VVRYLLAWLEIAIPMRGKMSESGKMILLVEDNEDNRIVYSTILKHFGYEVTGHGTERKGSRRPDHPAPI
jgi:hypothetical protein